MLKLSLIITGFTMKSSSLNNAEESGKFFGVLFDPVPKKDLSLLRLIWDF